jgi:hypothetical protein
MPQIALGLPAAFFAKKHIMILAHIFGVLAILYLVVLITVWCGGVLLFFARRAASQAFIPLLIWSYGVALGPWQFMASKEAQGGGGEGAAAITFFAQVGYALMLFMVFFLNVRVIDVLLAFALVMLVGIIFQFIMSLQTSRTESLTSSDSAALPVP